MRLVGLQKAKTKSISYNKWLCLHSQIFLKELNNLVTYQKFILNACSSEKEYKYLPIIDVNIELPLNLDLDLDLAAHM